MASRTLNVLAVADGSAGVQLVRTLAQTRHRVVAVMTSGRGPAGGSAVAELSRQVASLSDRLGIPTLPSESIREPEFASWIRKRRIDVLLNAHSLFVADADVVAAPTIGSFNLHPGPLPRYAGLNAPSWAIYNGETKHGVTLHWMDAGIDTGPIAYQQSFGVGADDTGLAVSVRCTQYGLRLLSRLLTVAAEDPDAIPRLEQDATRRSYFGREVPHDGCVSWALPARRVVDFVRACDYFPLASPWGSPRTRCEGRRLEILKTSRTDRRTAEPPATVGARAGRAVHVATLDEWVLVHRIRADGRAVDAGEILMPGHRLLVGPEGGSVGEADGA